MSKANGTLFSKSLFGYKKSDVNEYIRQADDARAEELAVVKKQVSLLEDQLAMADVRIKELEADIVNQQNKAKETLKKLSSQYEIKLSDASKVNLALKEKIAESDARATSYLKLADASKVRAENAEAKVAIFSSNLESANAEIKELSVKLAEKDAEIKRLSELEAGMRKYSAQREHDAKEEKSRYIMIKRPTFRWLKRK